MSIQYLSAPRYILKGEATYVTANESWWDVIDAGGARLCRVPMTGDQAAAFLKENGCEIISPLAYLALIRENA